MLLTNITKAIKLFFTDVEAEKAKEAQRNAEFEARWRKSKLKEERNMRLYGMPYISEIKYMQPEEIYNLTQEQKDKYKEECILIRNVV